MRQLDLILAHVWNELAGRHGTIHPTCRTCFDATAKSWLNDKTLAFRLDEVTEPESKPSSQYMADECFYCGGRGNPCNS